MTYCVAIKLNAGLGEIGVKSPATVASQRSEPAPPCAHRQVTRQQAIRIAIAAKKLNDLREAWLNPAEWTHRMPEITPLGMAHSQLDATVTAAYGWTDYSPDMPDEEILKRLLALNLERSNFIASNDTIK